MVSSYVVSSLMCTRAATTAQYCLLCLNSLPFSQVLLPHFSFVCEIVIDQCLISCCIPVGWFNKKKKVGCSINFVRSVLSRVSCVRCGRQSIVFIIWPYCLHTVSTVLRKYKYHCVFRMLASKGSNEYRFWWHVPSVEVSSSGSQFWRNIPAA